MAQKKLLLTLNLLKMSNWLHIWGLLLGAVIFTTNTALADHEWVKDMQARAQTIVSSEMLPPDPEAALRVFVSSSMSGELLKAYVKESKRYKAVLVFKGLPKGSWLALQILISDIALGNEEVAIQIDDEAFDRFGVKSVPSFVLSKDDREFWQSDKVEAFDKVTGNISIRGALELMAKEGDLAKEANSLLEESRK